MRLTNLIALFIAGLLLLGATALYFLPERPLEPDEPPEFVLQQLAEEQRVTGSVIHRNNGRLAHLYLVGYEPMTEKFSAIYLHHENKIFSSIYAEEISLGELYNTLDLETFLEEIAQFFEIELHFWLHSSPRALSRFVDTLGGVSLSDPLHGEFSGDERWLDGEMLLEFLNSDSLLEIGADALRARHKSFLIALGQELQEKKYLLEAEHLYLQLDELLTSNLSTAEFREAGQLFANLRRDNLRVLHPFPAQPIANKKIDVEIVRRMLPRPLKHEIELAQPRELIEVQVLNGVGLSGLADDVRDYLRNYDFVDVVETDNADHYNYETSLFIDRGDYPHSAYRLQEIFGLGGLRLDPSTRALVDVTLIVGEDMLDYIEEIDD